MNFRFYKHIFFLLVPPQIGTIAFTDSPANSGEPVSATCTVLKGDFPMKILWQHNGQPIVNDQSDIIVNTISRHMSVISIESAVARHTGEYTCIATNGAGAARQSATLVVNGRFSGIVYRVLRHNRF